MGADIASFFAWGGWDAIVGMTTGLLALFTARLASVAAQQTDASREAITAARQQADASQAAVDAALRSVDEAWKARVDTMAPWVVAHADKPEWPPRLMLVPQWDAVNATEAPGDRVFHEAQEPGQTLIVEFTARLSNEGRTSALIGLPNDAQFVDLRPDQHVDTQGRVRLRPNDEVAFKLPVAKPLSEWIEHWNAYEPGTHERGRRPGSRTFSVRIFGGSDEGVTDRIFGGLRASMWVGPSVIG